MMPETLFVGQETACADPFLLDRLADAEMAIAVAAIDGAANFVAGLPLFGVMAAVTQRGKERFSDTAGWTRAASTLRRICFPRAVVGYVSTDFWPEIKPTILANLESVWFPVIAVLRICIAPSALARKFPDAGPTNTAGPSGTLIATEAGGYVACFPVLIVHLFTS
jgi:hypothetical protein